MGLPLYLAITAAELMASPVVPAHCAYMACHFSPCGEGLANIPAALPEGAMLILNDRMPCQGHSPNLVAQQLKDAVSRLGCESVLLDFVRPPEGESEAMVRTIVDALPYPVAVSSEYAAPYSCPVFLPPGPLHVPLDEFLSPWKNREIWLEAALCQEKVTVSKNGTEFTPIFPTSKLDGGFDDDSLRCSYYTEVSDENITFTLFDTPESLQQKLEMAHTLGVSRAVGLYQELVDCLK